MNYGQQKYSTPKLEYNAWKKLKTQSLNRLSVLFTATLAGLCFASNLYAQNITINNPGFEEPVLANGGTSTNIPGWSGNTTGSIVNPSNDINAYDSNVYRATGITDISQVVGTLQEGSYSLSVKIGARPAATFGSYRIQLGVLDATGQFILLAEDSNTVSPIPTGTTVNERFETAYVNVDTTALPPGANIGDSLVINLLSDLNEVNFDNVELDFVPPPQDVIVFLQVQKAIKTLADGSSVPMWEFAECEDITFTSCTIADETNLLGPVIDAYAGFNVTINVQNTLTTPVSITIPGQAGASDGQKIPMPTDVRRTASLAEEVPANGGIVSYTWSSLKAGTYLYQSGTYPSLQVPMGLYGALIVHEDAVQAYPGISADVESLLLFSEIDVLQNTRVDQAITNLGPINSSACVSLKEFTLNATVGLPCTIDYTPRYLLINGGATINIDANPGDNLLLRFANAGLRSHIPSLPSTEFHIISEDGNLYPGLPQTQSALLLTAGKTHDALVTLPNSDITFSFFDRMPTFRNDSLTLAPANVVGVAAVGTLGGVTVGNGSVVIEPSANPTVDDNYEVVEDTVLSVSAPGVLGNDNVTPTELLVAHGPTHGELVLNPDGSFEYSPQQNFSGADQFTYSADGNLAFVSLNVSFENDAPVAITDGPFINKVGTTINVAAPGLLANDQDADGDQMTAVIDGATPAGLTLSADGSFSYSGASTQFSYSACDEENACSAPVLVTLNANPVANIALLVEDENGVAVTDYRWTVEEDTLWHPDPANPSSDTLATNFHKSYMPVVAQGQGAAEFAQLALDPTKHYHVSVLPADAAEETGHTVGSAQILPGASSVSVRVNTTPLPTAQISIYVFNDNSPTNGTVDGQEQGLGMFKILLEDAGGRYGASAGLLNQDAFGQPLTNALDCFADQTPAPGLIMSCPDTPENRAANVVGEVLIKNLYPGKYGVITTPPLGQSSDWVQTSTIEGTKVIDAWVKADEPPFFQEFGPAGWHVFVGFVNPSQLATDAPAGDKTVTGRVTNRHMSRPPNQTLWDSGSYEALAHTRAWVGVNSANGTGPNFQAVEVNEQGEFSLTGLPPGGYQLVIWDKYLDLVIGFRSFSLTADATTLDVGNVPIYQWFTRTEHSVFLDDGCATNAGVGVAGDGIRQECELPIPEQAVNLRWRDGTLYQSFPTDTEGFAPFDQVFPFFHWQVAEVGFARFKATGVTVSVDSGGNVKDSGGVLNPQVQADGVSTSRTETGPVLTQGFQGFLGQTSVFDWGKVPYSPGENGGISGVVYYASTRAENNPQLGVAEPWEPGVPGATVRLYRKLGKKPSALVINNSGFEGQAPGAVTGWDETGIGQVVDPSNNINAFDTQVYRSSGSTLTQQLPDVLEEGTYTLSVEVGARPAQSYGDYQLQLGIIDILGNFVVLAEDNNSATPNPNGTTRDQRFDTATLVYKASSDDTYLGANLAIRLRGSTEANFDNVQLGLNLSGLALIAETTTDSWDHSLPENCPGFHPDDALVTGGPADKCYDGIRNFNQVRPAVFDGGYAFDGIPAGKYVVEVVPPPGYEIVKEQDVNVGFGETYSVAPASVIFPTGGTYAIPDYAMVDKVINPGFTQPVCVGELHTVPDYLSLFPQALVEAPFAGAQRPLCTRKEVILSDQGNGVADFYLFTGAPIASHFVGMILDDTAQEFNPLSPTFGEKWAPPFVPVSIRDYLNHEVNRVYSDQWGRMNALLPSTYTANMPSFSGYSPAMLMTCMNDPGPIQDPANPENQIVDPQYNPAYSTFCYTFQYMPGTTTYLDTPVVPVSSYASGYNPPDCQKPTGTPKIRQVNGAEALGGTETTGPLVVPNGTLTVYSMGTTSVPNPDYEGPLGSQPKSITRDYGFGTTAGTVTLDGEPLTILSWANDVVTVQAPATQTIGQLMLTNNSGASTTSGITVTVWDVENNANLANRVIRVPEHQPSIQAAIDSANNSDLILISPGSYNELAILYKPIHLQGAGAGATFINATKRPTEILVTWREKMDCLYGIGEGCIKRVDSLTNQADGAAGFNTEEGAAITVVAPFDPREGTNRPVNRFWNFHSQIDGLSITGGDTGGGLFVNGFAHKLEISNNDVFGNQGSYHGGIRVGRPFLELNVNGPYAFNEAVNIHHNIVRQNGGQGGAGGGISMATGSDRYNISNNFVCGNFTVGDGAGIGHLGLSNRGVIQENTIVLNQNFNQAQTQSGGGVFIAGEPPVGNALTIGSGTVLIRDNLIQSNHAASGHGGGIRTQYVNGTDIVNNTTPADWYRIVMRNNIIVNNVAGWSAGGVSLQDTVDARIVSNTIAHNDSTATVGALVNTNISENQPAGIVAEVHSPALNAVVPSTVNDRFKNFSNPIIRNNIVWENRSFYYDAVDGTAKLIPQLAPAFIGECHSQANFWDFGVLGNTGFELKPTFSLLTDATGFHSSNVDGDAGFVSSYCNGARDTAGPMWPLPALDEGGATWIDVRFGPLKILGDYHISSGSSAIDNANNEAPAFDIDGDSRPGGGLNDMGADEIPTAN